MAAGEGACSETRGRTSHYEPWGVDRGNARSRSSQTERPAGLRVHDALCMALTTPFSPFVLHILQSVPPWSPSLKQELSEPLDSRTRGSGDGQAGRLSYEAASPIRLARAGDAAHFFFGGVFLQLLPFVVQLAPAGQADLDFDPAP